MVPLRSRSRVAALVALGIAGCAVVPRSRLEDARKVVQGLRADNARLKDTALALKGENDDLTQRGVDDARRVAALEDARTRLEGSVQGYIDDREAMVASYERFKRLAQARSATSPTSAALSARLRAFAATHPGTRFDPEAGVLSVEASTLFVPGTDRLRPDASGWLAGCVEALATPEAQARPLAIVGHGSDTPVRRAGSAPPTPAGDLSLPRAVRVRDLLADRLGRDPARIAVSGLGTSRPVVAGPDDTAQSRNARIEIDLSASPP